VEWILEHRGEEGRRETNNVREITRRSNYELSRIVHRWRMHVLLILGLNRNLKVKILQEVPQMPGWQQQCRSICCSILGLPNRWNKIEHQNELLGYLYRPRQCGDYPLRRSSTSSPAQRPEITRSASRAPSIEHKTRNGEMDFKIRLKQA
jgi:hypothetical protein